MKNTVLSSIVLLALSISAYAQDDGNAKSPQSINPNSIIEAWKSAKVTDRFSEEDSDSFRGLTKLIVCVSVNKDVLGLQEDLEKSLTATLKTNGISAEFISVKELKSGKRSLELANPGMGLFTVAIGFKNILSDSNYGDLHSVTMFSKVNRPAAFLEGKQIRVNGSVTGWERFDSGFLNIKARKEAHSTMIGLFKKRMDEMAKLWKASR